MHADQIDLAGAKHLLWHKMRDDLSSFVPYFSQNKLLLCPVCLRPLRFEDFTLEHIIPLQALADDPAAARAVIPANQRSGMTLLCQKQLIIKGTKVYNRGCNGWKGAHYDKALREIFRPGFTIRQFTERYIVAFFCAGYLGLFRKYGYQIALSQAGRLMRKQFFSPDRFLKELPGRYQMVLKHDAPADYDASRDQYWRDPFKFTIRDESAVLMVMRNASIYLPISRNPETPFSRALPYVPSKFRFRPDLHTAFE
jgi:hypothetical protein